jgi:patatin-like phospholipase/acyl hydrolase
MVAGYLLSSRRRINVMTDGEPPATGQKFRILSLDGGGVRGYLTAAYLAEAEEYLDRITESRKPLGERFDLICGTSTGAIIALALATGKTAGKSSKSTTTLFRRFRPEAPALPVHAILSAPLSQHGAEE